MYLSDGCCGSTPPWVTQRGEVRAPQDDQFPWTPEVREEVGKPLNEADPVLRHLLRRLASGALGQEVRKVVEAATT